MLITIAFSGTGLGPRFIFCQNARVVFMSRDSANSGRCKKPNNDGQIAFVRCEPLK
jgi:hypothetical protein